MSRNADRSDASGSLAGKRLRAFAQTWGRRIAASAARLSCDVPRLEREISAFGLYLLQLRLERHMTADAKQWLEHARLECLVDRGSTSRTSGSAEESEFGLQLASWSPGEGPARAREAYEQFRLSTGLGDTPLVGGGENLAALIFYITLHALVCRETLPTREQIRVLLRTTQETRKNLQFLVNELASGADESQRDSSEYALNPHESRLISDHNSKA